MMGRVHVRNSGVKELGSKNIRVYTVILKPPEHPHRLLPSELLEEMIIPGCIALDKAFFFFQP